MNPPTIAHRWCLEHLKEPGAKAFVGTSPKWDFDNPLPLDLKQDIISRLCFDIGVSYAGDFKNLFDCLVFVQKYNPDKIILFAGTDRLKTFNTLPKHFPNIEIREIPRGPESQFGDVSATKLRQLAREGNFAEFSKLFALKDLKLQVLAYNAIRDFKESQNKFPRPYKYEKRKGKL